MSCFFSHISASLVIGVIAAIIGASTLNSQTKEADYAAESARLLRVDSTFSKLSAEKGVAAAFLAYITDDARVFPINGPIITGKDAIREQLSGNEGALLTWQPIKAEASGNLGYTYGLYTLQTKDKDGKPVVRYGKYVDVWKKQANGDWKLFIDIGNPGPTPVEEKAR